MLSFSGKSVYPGVAFGRAVLLRKSRLIIDETPAIAAQPEWECFEEAKRIAGSELELLYNKTLEEIGEAEAGIIDVQRMILEDEDYIEMVKTHIMDTASRAAHAVSKAGRYFSQVFAALEDPYMKARASDFTDISRRLLRILTGGREETKILEPSIVIADDLSPSETAQMNKALIRAFIVRHGSANSHTAIMARALRIPMLIQTDIPLNTEFEGLPAAVDSHNGKLYLEPCGQIIRELETLCDKDRKEESELEKLRGLPSVTLDGIKVNVFANINGPEDLEDVLASDAEGIGIFRSEFLYLSRYDYPGEDEQFEAYRKVVQGMKGLPVVIRTLDIGADKNIPYFGLGREENPAMGLRAVRICFERPSLFKTQLRAIYRSSAFGNVSIIFPMIASLWELQRCKEEAARVREELASEGIPFKKVPLGIMVETPAAALVACDLAREADFFSVGTNDLTQYTLAVDRQNEKLSPYSDPQHPAVMKLLEMIAESACRAGIPAGICGEIASNTALTGLFLQMGYRELSVSPGFIMKIRQKIRSIKTGSRQ